MEFKTARFGSRAFPTYPCVFFHMRHAGGRGRVSTLLKSAIKCRDRVHRRDKREARESCCGWGRFFCFSCFWSAIFLTSDKMRQSAKNTGPPLLGSSYPAPGQTSIDLQKHQICAPFLFLFPRSTCMPADDIFLMSGLIRAQCSKKRHRASSGNHDGYEDAHVTRSSLFRGHMQAVSAVYCWAITEYRLETNSAGSTELTTCLARNREFADGVKVGLRQARAATRRPQNFTMLQARAVFMVYYLDLAIRSKSLHHSSARVSAIRPQYLLPNLQGSNGILSCPTTGYLQWATLLWKNVL